jgi:hypothetical protein
MRWPSDVERRVELAELGVWRLLVVADGTEPPEVCDAEDWCWASSDERDVVARLAQLRERASGSGRTSSVAGQQIALLGVFPGITGNGPS